MVMFPAVVSKEGVEAVLGVPGWAGVGGGCRLRQGAHFAVSVLPEEVVFRAPFAVAPFLLLPSLEGCMGRWELLGNVFEVLLGVHGFC